MKKIFWCMVVILTMILLMSTTAFAISGEGTEESPYIIETVDDFMVIGDSPNKCYKLNNDITLTAVLGDFGGTLDGHGFTLSTSQDYVFSSNSGTIKNLNVNSGILVEENESSGIMSNCNVTGTMLFSTNNGIVKNSVSNNMMFGNINHGTIKECTAVFDENYSSYTISLINDNFGIVQNSKCLCDDVAITKSTTISSQSNLNLSFYGICQNNYETGEIIQCLTNGTISLSAINNNTGVYSAYVNFYGICWANSGTISQCYSDCDVRLSAKTSNSQAFNSVNFYGICSLNDNGVVENCYSKSSCYILSGNYVYAYGIASTSKGIITNCYSAISVGMPTNVGIYKWIYGIGGKIRNNSYYLPDNLPSNSNNSDKYGVSKSVSDLKTQSTYEGWDFDNIWAIDSKINDGYPYLKWQHPDVESPIIEIGECTKGTNTISFDVYAKSPDELSGKIIVATYKNNNSTFKVKMYPVASEVNVSVDTANAEYIKVFWWDNEYKPITEYVKIDI